MEPSLRVLDGAVAVFCAVGGVEPQSETVWRQAQRFRVPLIAFINKMDKDTANFERALDEVQKSFETEPIPLQIPIGTGDSFSGIIDVVTMKAFTLSNNKMTEQDIPEVIKQVLDESDHGLHFSQVRQQLKKKGIEVSRRVTGSLLKLMTQTRQVKHDDKMYYYSAEKLKTAQNN